MKLDYVYKLIEVLIQVGRSIETIDVVVLVPNDALQDFKGCTYRCEKLLRIYGGWDPSQIRVVGLCRTKNS